MGSTKGLAIRDDINEPEARAGYLHEKVHPLYIQSVFSCCAVASVWEISSAKDLFQLTRIPPKYFLIPSICTVTYYP